MDGSQVSRAPAQPQHAVGRLSAPENDVVHDAIERLDEEAVRRGVELHIRTDFEAFARLRRSVGGVVNPTVDPKYSRLERDAFWVHVTGLDGALVGMVALKVFRTPDFMSLLRNERLWFDRALHAVSPDLKILDPFAPFGGAVSHSAGLWVHPDFRQRRFSYLIPVYVRALTMKLYAVDWMTTFVFSADQARAVKAYGFDRVEKVIDGYCPITGGSAELYMGRACRADIIAGLPRKVAEAVTTPAIRPAPAAAAD
jgi:hypothetical protein